MPALYTGNNLVWKHVYSQSLLGSNSSSYRLTVYWRNAVPWLGTAFWAGIDQGAIATANFLVSVFLARHLAAARYGAYALGFEVFLLLSVIYASFILEPMSVFGSSVYQSNLQSYLRTVLQIQAWVALASVFALTAAACVLYGFTDSREVAFAVAGVAVASPCSLLFWIARRVFYVNLTPRGAAAGALAYATGVIGALGLFYHLTALSPFVAFAAISVGALLAALLLLKSLKACNAGPRVSVREVIWRHWVYGRWAMASSVAIWGTGASSYFALSTFHGLSAAGEMKALMNLSAPVGQGSAVFSLLCLPYASRVHHQSGTAAVRRLVSSFIGICAVCSAAYFVVLVLWREPLLGLLYHNKYPKIAALIPFLGLSVVLRTAATAQVNLLRALQSPSRVFVAYGSAGLISALATIPMARAWETQGAIIAGVLGSIAACGISMLLLRSKLSQRAPSETLPSAESIKIALQRS
jgi:O-antigen/teichoic acid export membrane protein